MSDTIAAIATPVGAGGIGVVRISGPDSLAIASALFHPSDPGSATGFSPWRVYFGEIIEPGPGICVDQVLLTYFKSPKSYTAEDTVEISAHGGVYVVSKILDLVLEQGARLAEPGEFTRRAFLNGRVDLSQAEAVQDLIAAVSEQALRASVAQLQGQLSTRLNDMVEALLGVLAELEAAIDFPEEGLPLQKSQVLKERVQNVLEKVEELIGSYRRGKIFREGACITLVGKPNVGKSSLLNALLKEDRAIVTALPGTTRDTLEERVRIKDIHINIIDSAGLREHPEIIEKEGIQRTREALDRTDLALVIFDRSQPLDKNDELLLREVGDKAKLVVFNKCDLQPRLSATDLEDSESGVHPILISATRQTGLDLLTEAIYDHVIGDSFIQESVIITRARHLEHLVSAREALKKARDSLEQELSEEFVAVDMNMALESIGAILGKTFSEDLLDQIFNEFCIGK